MTLDLVSLINSSDKKEDGPSINLPPAIPDYSDSYPDCFFKFISRGRKIPPMKPDSYIRVSSIGNLCPRRETIRAKHKIDDYFNIDGSIGFAMMLGEAIHEKYRFNMGVNGRYVGSWKCVKCGSTTDDDLSSESVMKLPDDRGDKSRRDLEIKMMPLKCDSCKSGHIVQDKESFLDGRGKGKLDKSLGGYPSIIFNEWSLYNDEFKIRGHWDGARLDSGDVIVQEIKSCSGSFFKKVSKIGGYDPHITQLLTEMWLLGLKKGELTYINKSGWGDPRSYIKRFPFDLTMSYMERNVFKPVMELRRCLADEVVSDYGVCSNSMDEKSKDCIVRNFCFSDR